MTFPLTRFGDVVRQVKDKVDPKESGLERYVAGEHMETDNLHIRRWGDVGNGYLGPAFHMRFKPGQVIYGSRRTYLRKVAFAEFEGITANTTYVLEPKDPEILLPKLLPFIMQTNSFNEHSIKQSKGSVNPYINFSDITWYEFPLPPIDEQRRIADLLWAADDVVINWVDTYEQARKTFEVYAISLFQTLNEKFGTVSIGNIAAIKGGKRLPKDTTFSPTPTKHPYIRIVDFLDLSVKESDLKYLSEEVHKQIKNYIITDDDVYVSIAGTTGIVGIIPAHLSGANLTENAARLIIRDKNSFYKRFILHYLTSPRGQQSLKRQTMTTTQPKLAITRLAQITMPNPDYDEQFRIANSLDEFCQTLNVLNQHVSKSKELKSSLLNHHFG